MPYEMHYDKEKKTYFVVNKATGKVKGSHKTKEKAASQMRLLAGIEHGWRPTQKK